MDTGKTVITEPAPLSVIVTSTATTCGLNNGVAEAIVDGGTTPYAYAWSSGDNKQIATKLSAGTYNVVITDSNGCKVKHDAISIKKSEALVATLGNDIKVCPGNGITITPGNYISYTWQDGSSSPSFVVMNPGSYSVTVTDSIGCKATAVLNAFEQCQDILFPDGFTPNGDHLNDNFGPLGTLSAVKDFTLQIYSRWGQVVFASADPYYKWDGKIKGLDAGPGTYVWFAEYSFNGQPKKAKKGTVVLIK
jgi:gliding motility-associated-like protein